MTLSWYEDCVLTNHATRGPPSTAALINIPTNAVFKITDCKLYVPVVTLSDEEANRLFNQLKSGFKKTIKWNRYMSQISNQGANNNYLINPTFINVNRLLVLSYENEKDRTSHSMYYVPKVEIKNYNVIIDERVFFEIPVKNEEETYEKIIQISRNSDCTTGNLLKSILKSTTN